MFAYGDISRLK